jgi:purine-nucleoside phosphorylase
MQGRVHYYEGYPMAQVVLPVRLMKMMGAKTLILTNAAGGIKQGMRGGDLMLLTGQISSFVPSPLLGENVDELGERFPDMSEIYDRDLILVARKCACELGIDLQEGTYLQFSGPNYETPQEVEMARILGADAVGMSTACEAIAANHMGMKIAGISCITNPACGISPEPLSHEEVQRAADAAAEKFAALITRMIGEIGKTCR